ncbi:MAG: histidinol dehydrogenase, partial [Woeseiaceae bacterium]
MQLTDWSSLSEEQQSALLQRPAVSQDAAIRASTASIIAAVRDRGDAAVRELTRDFDRAELKNLKVQADEVEAANRQLSDRQRDAIDLAISNVRAFHEAQRPLPIRVETMPGVVCERFSHALDAVGLY